MLSRFVHFDICGVRPQRLTVRRSNKGIVVVLCLCEIIGHLNVLSRPAGVRLLLNSRYTDKRNRREDKQVKNGKVSLKYFSILKCPVKLFGKQKMNPREHKIAIKTILCVYPGYKLWSKLRLNQFSGWNKHSYIQISLL